MLAWKKGEKIAVWGIGFWGKRLYYKHRAEYQIACFIDNFSDVDELDGLPVVRADKVSKLQYKILIAVSEYESICTQCEKAGKKFYIDYLPYIFFDYDQISLVRLYDLVKDNVKKYFRIFLQNKKAVLMIGNCQTSKLKSSMRGSKRFDEEYIFIDVPMIHLLTEHDRDVLECCRFIFEESSLIITQHISVEAGGILSTNRVQEMKGQGTRIVSIPNLWFNCYYPQAKHQYRKLDLGNGRYAFPYADTMVDKLIEQYSVDEIIEIVKDPDLYSKRFLDELYSRNISELKEREKLCDIKMVDFITANWKKELLFYSVNHPNNHAIFEETDRILKFLGYEDFERDRVDITELDETQQLIYLSVKVGYGLEFKHDYYKDNSFEGKKTIDEYIRTYASYIHPQRLKSWQEYHVFE